MLKNWLSPHSEAEFRSFNHQKTDRFGHYIQFFSGKEKKLGRQFIGLIGLDKENAQFIRKALYEMSFPWAKKHIIDLGNLRSEDPTFAIQCLRELAEGGIIPILVGKGVEADKILFEAFNKPDEPTNVVWIQEKINQISQDEDYWNKLFTKNPYRINSLSLLGTQSHFRYKSENTLLAQIPLQELGLGKLRGALSLAEPILRDADIVSLNADVIRNSEATAQISKSTNGFFGEELCQISRYAGISDRVKGFSLNGFALEKDDNQLTANLMAQAIWYFIDGFMNRKGDYPLKEQNLTQYIIKLKSLNTEISFWKSTLSGRWWIQLPKDKNGGKNLLIACTYEDYLEATKEEIPDRLIKALNNIG